MSPEARQFSFARLALFALGAGAAVLVVSVPIVIWLAQVAPLVALIVALLALVVAVAVMGIVANRMVDRAARDSETEIDPQNIERD
jgi:divalent metal cation (Fe/Co/Zn/Cd) transporter